MLFYVSSLCQSDGNEFCDTYKQTDQTTLSYGSLLGCKSVFADS